MKNAFKIVHFSMEPVGTLEVYSLVNPIQIGPVDDFWWKDGKAPHGYGPFKSLWTCMDHYKHTRLGIPLPQDMVKSLEGEVSNGGKNVVPVDFANKRRL